jgi:predicted RNA binding protein YcfA (HicA-like mRNA interferase family)
MKMSDVDKICEKIRRGEILKVQEVEMILKHWGYIYRPGKGSHQNWKHPTKPKIMTIAVHGKELPRYITRELKKLMEERDET